LLLLIQAGKRISRVQEVTLEHVEEYRLHSARRKLSTNTIEVYLRAVKVFFRFLEKRGHIFSDPLKFLVIPRPDDQLPDVPGIDEMKKLLAAPDISKPLGVRDRTIIEVLYSTGVRRGELLRMTVFSPDLQNRTLRVFGKGRKERIVPLGKQACLWLKKYISESRPALLKDKSNLNALWVTNKKTALIADALGAVMYKQCKRAGIRRINPHAVRRACATHMLNNGAHPVQIQHLLGHATLATLSEYLKVSIPELKNTHSTSRPGG